MDSRICTHEVRSAAAGHLTRSVVCALGVAAAGAASPDRLLTLAQALPARVKRPPPCAPPLRRTLREAAHAAGGVMSVEPYTSAERPATPTELEVRSGWLLEGRGERCRCPRYAACAGVGFGLLSLPQRRTIPLRHRDSSPTHSGPNHSQELLRHCDVFSPNLGEAESMLGLSSSLTTNSALPTSQLQPALHGRTPAEDGDGGGGEDELTPHALELAGRA